MAESNLPRPALIIRALIAPLDFCGRHATTVLFLAVFVGLAWPDLARTARPLLPASVVLLLTATLLRLDWSAIARELRQPGLQVLLFPWQQLLLPVLVWAILQVLPLPPALEIALVLMAAAPPIMSAAALAMLLGLEGALALVSALIATLLTPLVLPPLALALLGLELDIGLAAFMGRLALIVGLAVALAVVLRRLIGKQKLGGLARPLDGSVVLLMLVFVVGIMDGVSERAIERPDRALLWFAAAWLANPLLQLIGWAAFAWLGRRRALTVALMTGNRNMGLLVAALPGTVDYDVVFFFGLAQIPMYMLPAATRRLYRRLIGAKADRPTQPEREGTGNTGHSSR